MKEGNCLNPNNNSKCTGKIFTKKGLCRSCMLAGRTYEDIYGPEKAQEQIDIRGGSERMKQMHASGSLNFKPFTGNFVFQQGKTLLEYWTDKYGVDIANEKQKELDEKRKGNADHLNHGEDSARFRKKSQETKDNWDEERREQYHQKMVDYANERMGSLEWKEDQSKKITDLIASGNWQPFNNHKNGDFISKDGSSQKYSSSWELARMMQLDDLGCSWSKHHKIRIPYIDEEGVNRNYAPDILVDNQFLEEIKPDGLLQYSRNQLKIAAGIEYCKNNNLEFRVINDTVLGSYIEKALEYHESTRNET